MPVSTPDVAGPAIAVIGAGLSGLACATVLARNGYAVQVFDKGRGPGGRMATRRADPLRFDHGAQYFTVRDPRFRALVDRWIADGVAARWDGRVVRIPAPGRWSEIRPEGADAVRYVGMPSMNAPVRLMASTVPTRCGVRVAPPRREGARWRLTDEDGGALGLFDAVVVSAPAAQTAALLADAPALAARAAAVRMVGCWAVMAAFETRIDVPFDAAFVDEGPLSWIARDGSKPGRPAAETWVLHAGPEWSQDHIERTADDAARHLLDAFAAVVPAAIGRPVHAVAHRWRFAQPTAPSEEECLYDPALGIGACGDWCLAPRLEGAFLSGSAAADRVMASRPLARPTA